MPLDVNTTLATGRLYAGLSPVVKRKVYAALLCQIVKTYAPSFNCDTVSNGCVSCLSPEKLAFLQVQLLCLINKTATPSFDCSAAALVASQNCLLCAEASVQLTVLTTLASQSLLVLNASANVDPSALLNANPCIACLDGQALEVEIALLLIAWLGVFQTVDVPGLVDDCDCDVLAIPGAIAGSFGFLPVQAIQFAPLSTSPPSAGPSVPVPPAATNVVDTSFSANWNAAAGATSYRLDVSTSNLFGSFVGIYNNLNVGNVTTFSVTGLTALTQYFYRLRAVNAGGTSANSNVISVTTTVPANLLVGLIHAYMFNEGSGATVPDRVGGKDLTIRGGAAWVTQAGQPAIQLNGTNQWLDTAAWAVGANDVSMIGWFYYTAAMITFQSMFIEKEAVNAQWELLSNLGYSLRGGAGAPTAGGTSPAPNAWHQLGGTITGTVGKVYADGVDVTLTSPVAAFTDASSALEIGRFNSGFFFAGFVGPVYIYNRAITAAEMLQLFNLKYLF